MAIEKLTTRLKNKTWTNTQIKNHKNSHEHRLTRTHVFKILNTINTLCGEKC